MYREWREERAEPASDPTPDRRRHEQEGLQRLRRRVQSSGVESTSAVVQRLGEFVWVWVCKRASLEARAADGRVWNGDDYDRRRARDDSPNEPPSNQWYTHTQRVSLGEGFIISFRIDCYAPD